MPGQSPARAPSPESPFAKNLNTGRNASNSRFFSDCYSRLTTQISDLIALSGVTSLPQLQSFGAGSGAVGVSKENTNHIKTITRSGGRSQKQQAAARAARALPNGRLSAPDGAGKPGFRVDRRPASYSQAPDGHAGRVPVARGAEEPDAWHIPIWHRSAGPRAAAAAVVAAALSASRAPCAGRALRLLRLLRLLRSLPRAGRS